MSERNQLILGKKLEDLMDYVYTSVLRDLPKAEKFTMGVDIRSLLWSTERTLIAFSLFTSGNRMKLLDDVDIAAKTLMKMIESGIRLRLISAKRQQVVAEKLAEIGRIVGGLKKRSSNQK